MSRSSQIQLSCRAGKASPDSGTIDLAVGDQGCCALKDKSPQVVIGAGPSQKRLKRRRTSLSGVDGSPSPTQTGRIREKKSCAGTRGRRSRQPHPPPANAETNGGTRRVTSDVIANEYCKVRVFELICNNVPVMLRKIDSYVNATQILKAAGIEKGKRIRILVREVARSDHEKVQGGCGKYQGTWVPFEKGVHLASAYGIDRELKPLFDLQNASAASKALECGSAHSLCGQKMTERGCVDGLAHTVS